VRTHHRDQRRRLRKVVNHLETDTNLHAKYLVPAAWKSCADFVPNRAVRLRKRLLRIFESAGTGFDQVAWRALPADCRKCSGMFVTWRRNGRIQGKRGYSA
jgi:hypothetical protein